MGERMRILGHLAVVPAVLALLVGCSGQDGAGSPDACSPQTCESATAECGAFYDGCGNELQCGLCNGADLCVSNKCVCEATTCAKESKNCGDISDDCGASLDCGTCTEPDNCGGGGTDNVCGCTALACQPAECGVLPDQCGGTVDCGTCPCEGFPQPDSCLADDICIDEACTLAFGRSYQVTVTALTVNSLSPAGAAWDALGGAPDPYVVVTLNDVIVFTSSVVQDVFTPTYTDTASFTIPVGSTFRFEAWDSDVGTDDWIIGCVSAPLSADTLSGQLLTCNGSAESGTLGTTLQVQLVPQ